MTMIRNKLYSVYNKIMREVPVVTPTVRPRHSGQRVTPELRASIGAKLEENQRARENGQRPPWKYKDIVAADGTSHGTIHTIKASLGLVYGNPRQDARKQVMEVEEELPTVPQPQGNPFAGGPADFVQAFEARYDEFKKLLAAKDFTIHSLEQKTRELRSQVSQMQFHIANYAGPSSNMGKSLGNGG